VDGLIAQWFPLVAGAGGFLTGRRKIPENPLFTMKYTGTQDRRAHAACSRPLTASQSCSSLAAPFDVEPGHDHDA